ncbi:hypothetical protein DICPUDRAFT_147567 [Dictyostelium purpureum]|uniref:Uncharacterized protein n=1 Tax=Dictyostelium purpureum TaxID=5786 RepID=F0Z8U2_DICPU|nr:uncharacterized protein DICPUDRAFT_147567 [Dictyostelium purpureum]EGC39605.1 hypothetical protein DICPUDRAFT_147567 [Dictyostelium purpureum]|eukprot:XP_003283826.1 hypothetical protein DICPUDRAFT_147567 [Dictyostelium purpureum]
MNKKSKNQTPQEPAKKEVEKKKASISVEVETPTTTKKKLVEKKKAKVNVELPKPSTAPAKKTTTKAPSNVVKKDTSNKKLNTNNSDKNVNNNKSNKTNIKKTTTVEEPKKKIQEKRKLKEIESESESEPEEEEEDLGVVPSSDEDDDEEDFDEIQADFDIVPCVEGDYHSIKNMIVRLIPFKEQSKFNPGELTELIIEQATKKKFGRSIHVDGTGGDPYGFISILNYNSVKKQETIQGYLEYINEKLESPEKSYIDPKLKEKSMKSYLSKLLSTSSTNQLGMFFSERFINIPNELAHPIYQFIQFDVELMQEKHDDKAYNFKNYLVLTTFGVTAKPSEEDMEAPKGLNEDDDEDESNNKQANKKSKLSNNQSKKITTNNKNQAQSQSNEDDIEEGLEVYMKCEDKYFKEHASAWAMFDIPYQYGKGAKWTLSGHLLKKGLIMVIPASKIQLFLKDLREKAILD